MVFLVAASYVVYHSLLFWRLPLSIHSTLSNSNPYNFVLYFIIFPYFCVSYFISDLSRFRSQHFLFCSSPYPFCFACFASSLRSIGEYGPHAAFVYFDLAVNMYLFPFITSSFLQSYFFCYISIPCYILSQIVYFLHLLYNKFFCRLA